MAKTQFKRDGGKIEIFPSMQGPMFCGYSIIAYKKGEVTPYKKKEGSIDDVKPLVLNTAADVPEELEVYCTFSFKASKPVFVGSKYELQLYAVQDGIELKEKEVSDTEARLKSDTIVTREQYALVLISSPAETEEV